MNNEEILREINNPTPKQHLGLSDKNKTDVKNIVFNCWMSGGNLLELIKNYLSENNLSYGYNMHDINKVVIQTMNEI